MCILLFSDAMGVYEFFLDGFKPLILLFFVFFFSWIWLVIVLLMNWAIFYSICSLTEAWFWASGEKSKDLFMFPLSCVFGLVKKRRNIDFVELIFAIFYSSCSIIRDKENLRFANWRSNIWDLNFFLLLGMFFWS